MEINDKLYNDPAVNDSAKSESIAECLLVEKNVDKLYSLRKVTRLKSYKTPSHETIEHDITTSRNEEHIAYLMYKQSQNNGNTFEQIGAIIDFQTPLRENRDDGTFKAIDMIAYDGKNLNLLELKVKDSNETLLRCVLEIFTYWKVLDHQKFLHDFGLPQDTVVKKAVFVFDGSSQHKEYAVGSTYAKKLMEVLDVDIYLLKIVRENQYEVLLP